MPTEVVPTEANEPTKNCIDAIVTLYEGRATNVYRLGQSCGKVKELAGGKDGEHAFSKVQIEQEAGLPPRLVARYGTKITVNASVNEIPATFLEGDPCTVLIFAKSYAAWTVKGITRPHYIKFSTEEAAKDLFFAWNELSVQKQGLSSVPTGLSSVPTPIQEGFNLPGSEGQEECQFCYNQGVRGDPCDNCNILVGTLNPERGSDTEDNEDEDDDGDAAADDACDEEDYYDDGACTQDPTGITLRPYGTGYGISTSTLLKTTKEE